MNPLKNYILVTQAEAETQTSSGIILAGDTTTGSKPAKVLAVGPDVNQVRQGEKIAIKWSEAVAVTYQGKAAALISEEFVYGIY